MTAEALSVHTTERVFLMEKNTIKKAGAIIINRELKSVALVFRPTKNDWTFPKGHIERGESEMDAMTREVLEETGMQVEIKSVLPDMEYLGGDNKSISVRMFLTLFIQNNPGKKIGEEWVKWIPINEVVKKLSYQNLQEYFTSVLASIRNAIL